VHVGQVVGDGACGL
jgi:hypothetical protein